MTAMPAENVGVEFSSPHFLVGEVRGFPFRQLAPDCGIAMSAPALTTTTCCWPTPGATGSSTEGGADFNVIRRECGTAPGGARRSPRPGRASSGQRKKEVAALLKDEPWFAEADAGLDVDDCPCPTLFLSEPAAPLCDGNVGPLSNAFDTADPELIAVVGGAAGVPGAVGGRASGGAAAGSIGTTSDMRLSPTQLRAAAAAAIEGSSSSRQGSGRARVEGGMNLSPRGSFERGKGKQMPRGADPVAWLSAPAGKGGVGAPG